MTELVQDEEPFYYDGKYLYNGQWYHEKFPLEWARSHIEGTGPNDCPNCADFGSVHCVFIGYCANCAVYHYDGSRGRGFMGDGQECSYNSVLDFPSIFDTYLQGINLNDITPIPGLEQNNFIIINNIIQYNEDDYLNADPYPDDLNNDMDVSIMNPHFEGGYNDW
jgi:hypothetical protein